MSWSLRLRARWLFSLSATLFSASGVSIRRSHPQPQETSSACSGEVVSSTFCKGISVCIRGRSRAISDCAVLRGRTQSILRELRGSSISEDFGQEIEQGASPCLLETFAREGGHILEDSIQHQRSPWEDSVDPQERHFRG